MPKLEILDAAEDALAPHAEVWLRTTGLDVERVHEPSGDADGVLVLNFPSAAELADLARVAGTSPILVAGAAVRSDVTNLTGVATGPASAEHEIRLRLVADLDPRAEGDLLIRGRVPAVTGLSGDVEVLGEVHLGLDRHAALTWRAATGWGVFTVADGREAWSNPRVLRTVARWLRHVRGGTTPQPVRVGLLGYGAIGHEHNRAVQAVPGLELVAVCDQNPDRIEVARGLAPEARGYTDGVEMLKDDDVDLVVVSTPPNSHHRWAMDVLGAGKHVVLEKPMALTAKQCDEVIERSREMQRVAVVYQNRRWDRDYLALRSLRDSGALGDIFHVETFVGGYGHPCNYWHSDATVSGGAIFDWGSHYLDQLLDLLGQPVAVSARNHKRVWLDVTNADHSRVTVSFADGCEATFIHSDLAAAIKPKYYVLGTAGAAVGEWQRERIVSATDIGTVHEHRFAPADAPARIRFLAPDGSLTDVALPEPQEFGFHRELAALVLEGLPMSVTAAQSRQVVAVMEAAEQSAAAHGEAVELS
jgi:predicted dehydrogenase